METNSATAAAPQANVTVQADSGQPQYFSVVCAAITDLLGVIAVCNAIDNGDVIKAKIASTMSKWESEMNTSNFNAQENIYNNDIAPYLSNPGDPGNAARIGAANSQIAAINQGYQQGLKGTDSSVQSTNQSVSSDANDKNSLITMAGAATSTSGLTGAMQAARS